MWTGISSMSLNWRRLNNPFLIWPFKVASWAITINWSNMRNVRCRSTDKEIFHLFKLMNNHWQTLAPIKVTFFFFFSKIFNRRYDELPHAALFYKAKFEAKKRSNRLKYGIILRNSSLLLTQIFSFSSHSARSHLVIHLIILTTYLSTLTCTA